MPKIATRVQMDSFDRAILKVVQQNNQLSHATIGIQVGLSASAVRRRLQALRSSGIIARDVALLNSDIFGVTLIVTVTFDQESLKIYADFETQMCALPQVRQCYHVAGTGDYLLIVHAPSLRDYEDWSKRELMANAAIRRYDSVVSWSCKKFETAIDTSAIG